MTLIELLVSIVIISIGLVALSQLYMSAMWTYQKSRSLSLATERAQLELEKVHAVGYEGLQLDPLTQNPLFPSTVYTATTNPHGVTFPVDTLVGGSGKITVQPYQEGGAPVDNIVQVVVEIDWDGAPRAQTNVRIVTYKTGPTPTGGSTP
jgi:prepilin-type N-terminal cleavage/methylation domain-containing protein